MVCFIHSLSSRSWKSSRACAPRLSLRASAEYMVCAPCTSKFCSSSVSTRSVFQTIERSVMPTSAMLLHTSSIFTHPSASLSCTRKTAAWFCMVFCRLPLISAVESGPLEWRSLSRLSIEASPALAGSGLSGAAGLVMSLMRLAHARPKTTMSSSELAPRRLAPCTEAHAASPAAKRPGTTLSGSLGVGLTTSPKWLVGMPPML
mmetsp:Transcript_4183/g.8139  ORF Transcript_4183/g.8139 Transcript_4183/m.8139 type:complete len:204 (+) Transcript_4183:404-1015(+)